MRGDVACIGPALGSPFHRNAARFRDRLVSMLISRLIQVDHSLSYRYKMVPDAGSSMRAGTGEGVVLEMSLSHVAKDLGIEGHLLNDMLAQLPEVDNDDLIEPFPSDFGSSDHIPR